MSITANATADFTARELIQLLFKSEGGRPPDLSGKSLRELDLSGIYFKGAKLSGADLYGADLAGARLADVDLSGARLDRATLTRAEFANANLEGATLLRPTIFSGLERNPSEAPRFTGARMKGAQFSGWLDGTDFSHADLSRAQFGKQDALSEGLLASRVRMAGCNFTGASLVDAYFRNGFLVFAKFAKADVRGANFRDADLARADFTAANVADMDVTGANLDEANFKGAQGLDKIKGLSEARNADRMIR